jgi:uncharacterized protein (TIGR02466 family)
MLPKPTVKPIFPIPTVHSHLSRDFTDEEISFINEIGKKTVKNEGNSNSYDNYVLEHPALVGIKEELMHVVRFWFTDVYFNKTIEPYITQSWLNWTTKNQYHHKHTHSNSIVSGVLYIHGLNERIDFERNAYQQIKITPDNEDWYNEYNNESTWVSTPPGKILLFPSGVTHSVERKQTDELRVSLAFNVFVRGTLGKASSLTELRLE